MDSTYDTTYYTTSYASDSAAAGAASAIFGVFALVWLAIIVVFLISLWRLFVKAGKPGWAAIVPIYNQIVMLEIAGRPVWWFLIAMFVPFFGWWVQIVWFIDFAKSYGKSTGYGVFVALLPLIAVPVLAFSKTAYVGPAAAGFDGFVPAPDRAPGAATPAPAAPPQSPQV